MGGSQGVGDVIHQPLGVWKAAEGSGFAFDVYSLDGVWVQLPQPPDWEGGTCKAGLKRMSSDLALNSGTSQTSCRA